MIEELVNEDWIVTFELIGATIVGILIGMYLRYLTYEKKRLWKLKEDAER